MDSSPIGCKTAWVRTPQLAFTPARSRFQGCALRGTGRARSAPTAPRPRWSPLRPPQTPQSPPQIPRTSPLLRSLPPLPLLPPLLLLHTLPLPLHLHPLQTHPLRLRLQTLLPHYLLRIPLRCFQ
eukprot:XP_001710131.1 Hypothetical protein GL50803_27500 [Giardia lamblia ATCC 50803]